MFYFQLGTSEHSTASHSDHPIYHRITSSSSTMEVSTGSSHLLEIMLEDEDIEMDSSTGDSIARNRSVTMSVSDGDSYDADGETSSDNEGDDVLMRTNSNL